MWTHGKDGATCKPNRFSTTTCLFNFTRYWASSALIQTPITAEDSQHWAKQASIKIKQASCNFISATVYVKSQSFQPAQWPLSARESLHLMKSFVEAQRHRPYLSQRAAILFLTRWFHVMYYNSLIEITTVCNNSPARKCNRVQVAWSPLNLILVSSRTRSVIVQSFQQSCCQTARERSGLWKNTVYSNN